MRNFLRLGTVLAVVVLIPACDGGDETTIINYNSPQPTVALLANTLFVDYRLGNLTAEASNVQAQLESYSLVVEVFGDVSDQGLADVLAGKRLLVIPELENGDLNAALTANGRAAILNFVNEGGTLIIFGGYLTGRAATLLNAVFTLTLVEAVGGSSDTYTLNAVNAAGTPFADDPASVEWNDGTMDLDLASLPSATDVIYGNSVSGDAGVALIPFGAGRIVYLGWDWYQGGGLVSPPLDFGWLQILQSATLFPA